MTDKHMDGSQVSGVLIITKSNAHDNINNCFAQKGSHFRGQIVVISDGESPNIRDIDDRVIQDDSKNKALLLLISRL